MSSFTNNIAIVLGGSRSLANAIAGVLGEEFAHVIVLDHSATGRCRTGGSSPDSERTFLDLDTNGRPLRDWED